MKHEFCTMAMAVGFLMAMFFGIIWTFCRIDVLGYLTGFGTGLMGGAIMLDDWLLKKGR